MTWIIGEDPGTGEKFDILHQEKDMSCMVACTGMVIYYCTGKKIDESTLRNWFKKAEGADYLRSHGIVNYKDISSGVRSFDSFGVIGASQIVTVLSEKAKLKYSAFTNNAYFRNKILTANRKKPVVLVVDYDPPTNSRHAIVAIKNHNNQVVILDPAEDDPLRTDTATLPRYDADLPGDIYSVIIK